MALQGVVAVVLFVLSCTAAAPVTDFQKPALVVKAIAKWHHVTDSGESVPSQLTEAVTDAVNDMANAVNTATTAAAATEQQAEQQVQSSVPIDSQVSDVTTAVVSATTSTVASRAENEPRLVGSAVSKSVVIAGMVKDGERTLPGLLRDLTNIACLFSEASLVVLESNSRDHTVNVLNDFVAQPEQGCHTTGRTSSRPFKEIKMIYSPPSPNTQRIHRLVKYRKELRNRLADFKGYDYIFMVDMDIVGIDIDALQTHLPSYVANPASSFHAVCLNDHFRDSYAMVAKDRRRWAYPAHVRSNRGDELLVWNVERDVEKAVYKADGKRSGALEVSSCFNAATLYSTKMYLNPQCDYKTTEDAMSEDQTYSYFTSNIESDQMCEHVYFHDCLRRFGGFKIGLSLFSDYITHPQNSDSAFASALAQVDAGSVEAEVPSSARTRRKWSE